MKRRLVTAAAVAGLAATASGAIHVTAPGAPLVCIPPAVVHAWS